MEILQKGLVQNRTKKYVFPVIYYYDKDFYSRINSLLKRAVGIDDEAIDKDYSNHLFILVDISQSTDIFKKAFEWLKENHYIVTHYAYDNVRTGSLHMLVFNIPPQKPNLIDKFISGHYSELYNPHEIELFFMDKMKEPNKKMKYVEEKQNAINVMTKNKYYRETFISKVNRIYDLSLSVEEYFNTNPEAELDFPPIVQQETFSI